MIWPEIGRSAFVASSYSYRNTCALIPITNVEQQARSISAREPDMDLGQREDSAALAREISMNAVILSSSLVSSRCSVPHGRKSPIALATAFIEPEHLRMMLTAQQMRTLPDFFNDVPECRAKTEGRRHRL